MVCSAQSIFKLSWKSVVHKGARTKKIGWRRYGDFHAASMPEAIFNLIFMLFTIGEFFVDAVAFESTTSPGTAITYILSQ